MSTARQESSIELATDIERRWAPRRELRLPVLCEWGLQEPVAAELINISLSGALLDFAALQVLPSARPTHGAILKVELQLPGSEESIGLTGSVVRHTRTGLAIQFFRLPDQLRQFLDQFEQASVPPSLTPDRET